jgi:sugar lactone lactonase YvrE
LSLFLGGAGLGERLHAQPAPRDRKPDAFDRQLQRLRQVDEGLIGYDETDRILPGLEVPRGVATGARGRVWVVGDRELVLLVAGRESRRVRLPSAPSCVCESPDGTCVYVGLGDRVAVWSSNGTPRATWPAREGESQITSIVAAHDQVFLADAQRRTVERHHPSGAELGRFGDTSDPPRHFVVPSPFLDLAVSPAGGLWVTNPGRHLLESFAFDGTPLSTIGRSGASIETFCGCCNPTHVAVLPDGRLVTAEKGLPRVKVLDPSGRLVNVVAAGDRLSPKVVGLDLAVDAQGNILVLDPSQRAVRVFTPRRRRGGSAL